MYDPAVGLQHLLQLLRADIYGALAQLAIPAYILDREGTVRWMNSAGFALWPEGLNRKFGVFMPPEEINRARDQFARKVMGGAEATRFSSAALDGEGNRVEFEVSSVALHAPEGEVVGVFGVISPRAQGEETAAPEQTVELTPRQRDVLRLLGEGRSTPRIAQELGIAEETARNHIKAVLRSLGARSRLEAVVAAHRRGLL
jgi:DNA-binding CsgD family transcriptional regulator